MHVVFTISKFYDWVPVPPDVTVTPEDIASGKVMPAAGGGWKTRVLREPNGGTIVTCTIKEADLIGKIVHEKTDVRRAGRTFSRRQAVAHLIQDNLLEPVGVTDWSWIQKVEVHDDGPDEALARGIFALHTAAPHGRRPGMNLPPEHVEEHLRVYLEPATPDEHADHLHGHFGVRMPS